MGKTGAERRYVVVRLEMNHGKKWAARLVLAPCHLHYVGRDVVCWMQSS